MNILVADDTITNLKLIRAQLEAEGHAVVEAADGIEALKRLEQTPVDAVISDILMPQMDGYRLCHEIRRSVKFNALPVVLYTSTYVTPKDRQLAEDMGADYYLVKPAPTSEILNAVQVAMKRSAERKRVLPKAITEDAVLKQYSQVLVHRLEEKNVEIHGALEKVRVANEAIQDLNRNLISQIEQRSGQLELANRELEAFSYTVSHDLRAPLRQVNGYLELLMKESAEVLPAQSHRYAEQINNATSEMGMLIEDLLAFSRAGQTEFVDAPVNVEEVIRTIIAEFQNDPDGRVITWSVADLPTVTGDPMMIKVALTNLIGNAVKFSRMRNPAEITIGVAGDEDERAILFVKDNGAGFDMRDKDKLFGAFQRLHTMGEFEGTGIGLATVKRIVTRLGGRVWAEGAVDRGATFYFTLPIAALVPVS